MSVDENNCRIDVLSRTPHCTVGYCQKCQTFHVDLGSMCLKLHPLQLHALRGSLSEALEVFARQRNSAPRKVGPAMH